MKRALSAVGIVRSSLAALVLAAACSAVHAATLYKWIDENGVTHYSDSAPRGAKWQRVPDSRMSVIPDDQSNKVSPRPRAVNDADLQADADAQAAERALAERRDTMLKECEQNRGVECEKEVDTELRAEAIQQKSGVIRRAPPR